MSLNQSSNAIECDCVADFVYKSRFEDWYHHASVRAQPRRMFKGEDCGKLFFSPELVPIANHELVVERGLAGEVLLQHVIHHLSFTNALEHVLVNHVTLQLAQHEAFSSLPREMRFDAHKIYCDEAYHALFSADLVTQLEKERQVSTITHVAFPFTTRVAKLRESIPPKYQHLFEAFAAIVSETLISSTLGFVPRDTRVVTAIRDTIRDHAFDEGLHHAYFSQLLEVLWPRLEGEAQSLIGRTLPSLIEAFLLPDVVAWQTMLSHLGLSEQEQARVIEESYPAEQVHKALLKASRATRALFEHNGVLAVPEIHDVFAERGMLYAN
jgi:hypothetical protein